MIESGLTFFAGLWIGAALMWLALALTRPFTNRRGKP